MSVAFEYGFTDVRSLQVTNAKRRRSGKLSINSISVDGQLVKPTQRFWKSFFIRYGISDNVFRYFHPSEVFDRIAQVAADDRLRYCIERPEKGGPRLLAVTNPSRPVIRYAEVVDLLSRYTDSAVDYDTGIVTSTHTPRCGAQPFTIGGDALQHRFVMETPVDGFSHPKVYLSFLRLVCSNGMIGYGRTFRSDISLGKDLDHCITRVLESFDNGEGYAALRQRFERAQKSWASVRECTDLQKLLVKLSDGNNIQSDHWRRDFHRMTGSLNTLYGLANLDGLSKKRQRILPARCRVYDLMNFATEIATHRAPPESSRQLQAFVGSLVSDEFDMEGTAETVTDFADFFIQDDQPGPSASLN